MNTNIHKMVEEVVSAAMIYNQNMYMHEKTP